MQNQDVIQTLSIGPLSILPGDSTEVAFAIVTASSLPALFTLAASVQGQYTCIAAGNTSVVDLSPSSPECGNQTLDATTPGALSYAWSTGATSPTITTTTSGTFAVRIEQSTGCYRYGTAEVQINPALTPLSKVFALNGQAAAGEPIAFRDSTLGATTWLWNFGNGFGSTLSNTTYSYPAPGTYTVSLTVSNAGCNATYTTTLVVSAATGLDDEVLQATDFQLYPNPTTDGQVFLRRVGRATGAYQLLLTDTQGHMLYQTTTFPGRWVGDLPIPVPTTLGIYLLRLQKGNTQATYKILRR
jgi:serine protease